MTSFLLPKDAPTRFPPYNPEILIQSMAATLEFRVANLRDEKACMRVIGDEYGADFLTDEHLFKDRVLPAIALARSNRLGDRVMTTAGAALTCVAIYGWVWVVLGGA